MGNCIITRHNINNQSNNDILDFLKVKDSTYIYSNNEIFFKTNAALMGVLLDSYSEPEIETKLNLTSLGKTNLITKEGFMCYETLKDTINRKKHPVIFLGGMSNANQDFSKNADDIYYYFGLDPENEYDKINTIIGAYTYEIYNSLSKEKVSNGNGHITLKEYYNPQGLAELFLDFGEINYSLYNASNTSIMIFKWKKIN